MRTAVIVFALLVQATSSAAKQPATELFLSKEWDLATAGKAEAGETMTYFLEMPADGPLKFVLNAENETCGYDISVSSQLGVLASFGRFPVRHDATGLAGDIYTISLFQTRTAWNEKVSCKFSLKVQ